MGKSAGKWIKTVLFGKKYSKSNFSKNVTPDKDTAAKTPVEEISQNPPVISDPYQSTEIGVETLELEKGAPGPHCDTIALSPLNQGLDSQSDDGSAPVSDGDMKRQEHAAAKAQAAFRGYLARRAFRALKGIIRLQALIRGHLVRRQAVATLRCMQAIVKVQALARGRKVDVVAASSFFGSEKLATNTFVRKLIVKMPTATPLRLQYDVAEPNSAWSWLERWSASHFWEPPARTKKATKSKPHRKQGSPSPQTVEPESGKSKRTIRKVPTAANGDNSTLASEMDKPKRNPGKLTSNQTEVAQDQAQSELERVKRNLRKVSSSSSVQAAEKSETETEKPRSVEIAKASAPPDVPDLEIAVSPENTEHSDGVADKPDFLETHLENEPVDAPLDNHHPAVETQSVENGVKMESVLNLDDDLSFKEEEVSKENPKIRKRRSLPAKQQQQEFSEKMSQNSPSLPSYMAATESAKAKLRGQGPLKHGEDGADIGNARRHSLPASTNGKLNSLSPRVQANAKGGSKTNATLTSRDDKVVQPGWRR